MLLIREYQHIKRMYLEQLQYNDLYTPLYISEFIETY